MTFLSGLRWQLLLFTSAWLGTGLETAPQVADGLPQLRSHLNDVPQLVARATDKLAQEMTSSVASSRSPQDAIFQAIVPGAAVRTNVGQAIERLQKEVRASGTSILGWTKANEDQLSNVAAKANANYRTLHESVLRSQHSLDAFLNASHERQAPFVLKFNELEASEKELEENIQEHERRLNEKKLSKDMAKEKKVNHTQGHQGAPQTVSGQASNTSSQIPSASGAVSVKVHAVHHMPNSSHIAPQASKQIPSASGAVSVKVHAVKRMPNSSHIAPQAFKAVATGQSKITQPKKALRGPKQQPDQADEGLSSTQPPKLTHPVAAAKDEVAKTRRDIQVDFQKFLAEPDTVVKRKPRRSHKNVSSSSAGHASEVAHHSDHSEKGSVILKVIKLNMSHNLKDFLAHGRK